MTTSAAERLATLAGTLDTSAMLPSTQISGGVSQAPPPGGSHTHVWNEAPTGTVDGANDTFTLSAIPVDLMLFKNGLLQRRGSGNDFTLTGDVVTFQQGNLPQLGDIVLVSYTT